MGVIEILLQDEHNVFMWLSQYGTLTRAQVMRLLRDKPLKTAEKIIKNLKQQLLITESSDGYFISADPPSRPDPRMISAVWVLLQFIDDVEPAEHYPADYPAQIFFLKKNVCYEIVVIYDGEQHLTRLLQPEDGLKYIIAAPKIQVLQECKLPKAPCLLATVEDNGGGEPGVTFYTGGQSNGR